MLLLRIFRRILCVIVIVKATVGQQHERVRHEQHEPLPDSPKPFVRTLWPATPYYDRKSLMHQQYENGEPTHRFNTEREQQQTENGNSLAPKEIAMEILSESFPADTKSFDDVFKRLQILKQQQRQRKVWRLLNDISSIRTNFRGSQLYAQRKHQQEMEKLHSENSNWHENAKGAELNADFAPVYNDDSDNVNIEHNAVEPTTFSEALHTVQFDNNGEDVYPNFGHASIDNLMMKSTPTTHAAALADNANAVKSIFRGPTMTRKNGELYGVANKGINMKRNPLGIDNYKYTFAQPRYPYALSSNENNINYMKMRSSKRERTPIESTPFLPSISAGAMTNLGTFFGDLSKNVRYSELEDIHEAKAKLLDGDHPLNMLRAEVDGEDDEEAKIDKTAQFLHAIRSYRPSQRIRSLVSMTPQGYHGSNFLDPNYMWVGLG